MARASSWRSSKRNRGVRRIRLMVRMFGAMSDMLRVRLSLLDPVYATPTDSLTRIRP
jgi:hypothetical protein